MKKQEFDDVDYELAYAFETKPEVLYEKFNKIGCYKSSVLSRSALCVLVKKQEQALRLFNSIEV